MLRFVLSFLIVVPLLPSVAHSQTKTAADKAVDVVVTLCAGAHGKSDDFDIKGDGQGGLSLLARGLKGSGRIEIDNTEMEGFVDALREEQDSLSTGQRDKSRACMKEYIGQIIGTILSEGTSPDNATITSSKNQSLEKAFIAKKDEIYITIDGQVEIIVIKVGEHKIVGGKRRPYASIEIRTPRRSPYNFRQARKGKSFSFEYRRVDYQVRILDVDFYEEAVTLEIAEMR